MSPSTQERGGRQDELIGQTVSGRYRIDQLLAVGGMAQVYLAEHIHIRKRVAIKVLRPDAEGFSELASRFEREAIAGAHIDHPNVASALDFGWLFDGSAFVALEFVEGVTLRNLIARGPLAPERAAHITRQIAAALSACHELGVLHRDLKPGNVMVDEDRGDLVKLIDFGLARVPVERVSRSSSSLLPPPPGPEGDEPTLRNLTCKGIVFGTITYMPPEIALGMDVIDERSDLYALGVMLYEMLSGKPPFDMREPAELLLTRRTSTAPPIASRNPTVKVPPALEAVASRLLSPSPRARYQTAHDTIAAIDAALAAPPPIPVPAVSEPDFRASSTMRVLPAVFKSTRQLVQGHSRMRAAGAVVAGAAVVVLALWSFDQNMTDQTTATPPVITASEGLAEAAKGVGARAIPTAAPSSAGKASLVTLRKRFLDAHKINSWLRAGRTLIEIVDADATALDDDGLRQKAAQVAVNLDYSPAGTGTKLFEALAHRAGSPGHDLLYAVLSGKGGSPAAERAAALLREPAVRAAVEPELAVALDLREAGCKDKPSLFERGGKEGDGRTLVYLRQLRAPRCDARRGECCFHGNKKLSAAIEALEHRLR